MIRERDQAMAEMTSYDEIQIRTRKVNKPVPTVRHFDAHLGAPGARMFHCIC